MTEPVPTNSDIISYLPLAHPLEYCANPSHLPFWPSFTCLDHQCLFACLKPKTQFTHLHYLQMYKCIKLQAWCKRLEDSFSMGFQNSRNRGLPRSISKLKSNILYFHILYGCKRKTQKLSRYSHILLKIDNQIIQFLKSYLNYI